MSLVVLKKKSQRYLSVVSGRTSGGFSIVGGRRNQGWVGQDNLGRHLVRTCSNAGFCCTNDPSIIKRSTMTTSGLLATRKHPTVVFHDKCDDGRCRGDWVKDFNPLNHGQGSRIEKMKIGVVSCYQHGDVKKKIHDKNELDCKCRKKTHFIGGVRHTATPYAEHTGSRDASEYIVGGLMKKKCLPTPENKKPFPFVINHIGCDLNYATPEQAIWSGELPEDWMSNTSETDVVFSVNPYL
jgi:hypothetical protein